LVLDGSQACKIAVFRHDGGSLLQFLAGPVQVTLLDGEKGCPGVQIGSQLWVVQIAQRRQPSLAGTGGVLYLSKLEMNLHEIAVDLGPARAGGFIGIEGVQQSQGFIQAAHGHIRVLRGS